MNTTSVTRDTTVAAGNKIDARQHKSDGSVVKLTDSAPPFRANREERAVSDWKFLEKGGCPDGGEVELFDVSSPASFFGFDDRSVFCVSPALPYASAFSDEEPTDNPLALDVAIEREGVRYYVLRFDLAAMLLESAKDRYNFGISASKLRRVQAALRTVADDMERHIAEIERSQP